MEQCGLLVMGLCSDCNTSVEKDKVATDVQGLKSVLVKQENSWVLLCFLNMVG